MPINFCPTCGTARISPTSRFCHVCGTSLIEDDTRTALPATPAEQSPAPTLMASPPIPLPANDVPLPLHDGDFSAPPPFAPPSLAAMPTPGFMPMTQPAVATLAVSSGRATGVTIAIDVITIAVLASAFINPSALSEAFGIALVALAIVGAFWYALLRLPYARAERIWLAAAGFSLLAFWIPSTLVFIAIGQRYYYFSDYYFSLEHIVYNSGRAFGTTLVASLIGVSIASGFARWRHLRPQMVSTPPPRGNALRVYGLLAFFVIIIALFFYNYFPLRSYYASQNFLMLSQSAVIVGTIAISIVARRMALQRLRAQGVAVVAGPVAPPAPIGAAPGMALGIAPAVPGQRPSDGLALATMLVFIGAVISGLFLPNYFFATVGSSESQVVSTLSNFAGDLVGPSLGYLAGAVAACVAAIVLMARYRTAINLLALRRGTMLTAIGGAVVGIGFLFYYASAANDYVSTLNSANYCDPSYSNCTNVTATYTYLTAGPGLFVTGGLLVIGAILAAIRLVRP
jgi:hypothetical protein